MKRVVRSFFVIQIPLNPEEGPYPNTLFSCETLGEALSLCQKMNVDAGGNFFTVRGFKPSYADKTEVSTSAQSEADSRNSLS